MFQFRAFPSYGYLIHRTILEYCSSGFPHSDISGSSLICSSPKLFAACHVLHRLLMPRHSPCALISLTKFFWFSELCRLIQDSSRNCFTLRRRKRRIVRSAVFARTHLLRRSFRRRSESRLSPRSLSTIASEFPSVALLVFPLFSFQCAVEGVPSGGLKWTRTTDLTIISRVL